ncbi:DUF4271 domain-containing protein [Sphingobacterium hungaricum]|uniref:DUF4271 domain-containing protein n=1 Tax=Sphingobacterium hungaricum TaxID=2082723 RepID=A0A928YPH0_9SPHI|nr:DUF4271 domain-containing protein [Sphingobacterium hungaricum]MBE8713141.1 DUF4271 domain-containing protein [Sphingobacterium hungaricum]
MQRKVFLFFFSLLFVNLLSFSSYAQTDLNLDEQSLVDSSSVADSVVDVRSLIYNEYVFPDPNRQSQFVEDLKEKLIVKNGDFIGWMKLHDELMLKKFGETEFSAEKFHRPIWVFAVVLGLFLALAIVKIFFPVDFSIITEAFYKDRLLIQVSKEDNMATSWSYIILYIIFSAALALFILITESGFNNSIFLNPINYIKIAGIVGLLFILKILIIRFVAFVFLINRIVREYIAVLYLIYFNSLLILMPFLLIVTLVPQTYFKFLLILFSVIVIILFIYRFVRTAFNFIGNSKFSVFYLFLYLCSLEVAPILILVKTLSN